MSKLVSVAAVLAQILGATPNAANQEAQHDASIEALAALVGLWVADADPHSPGVTGWTSFQKDVQDHVVVRRNHAEYPATKDRPASTHDDLMVAYVENGQLRADYFDNEGHTIRYAIKTPKPSTLVFVSEAHQGAPRFRLTYTLSSPAKVALSFEIAPPNAPEQFKPYIAATLHKE